MLSDLQPDGLLSPSTLRRRFDQVQTALGLPARRTGRWLSARVMDSDIYRCTYTILLAGRVRIATFAPGLKPDVRFALTSWRLRQAASQQVLDLKRAELALQLEYLEVMVFYFGSAWSRGCVA